MAISQVSAQQSVRATTAVAALRANAAANAAASSGVRQADTVDLSDTARALSTSKQSIAGAADVREDRVAALKAAIANGTYSVSSRQLARSMLTSGRVSHVPADS
jgi:negative regulator of flagellin synthesis FlgM